MLARLRELVRRHRYKLVAVAALGGGAYLLKWYAERRLRDWAEGESHRMLEKVKKQAHFESTRSTCRASLAQLAPRLLAALSHQLDTDGPLEALRAGTPHKLQVWADLKRLALQRVVAAVYGAAYLTVLLHVHVHVLGGCLYVDSVRQTLGEQPAEPLDEAAQQRCLAGVEQLLTVGLERLTQALAPLLAPLADALALTDRLDLEGIETLLWRAQELVESEPEWRLVRFALDEASATGEPPLASTRLDQLTTETRDLLENAETDALVRDCTRAGFGHVLDQLVPAFSGQGGGADGFVAPRAATLPVAKLVPTLTNLPHVLLRTGPDSLPWLLANHHKVQVLAANVYESFSELT